MSAADSNPAVPVASSSHDPRRRWLLVSACTLLAVGVGLNVHRYLQRDVSFQAIAMPSSSGVESEPPRAPSVMFAMPEDEAAGQGQIHRGEEGKMGRPSSKARSGLYALKGPANVVPQMAASFDPQTAARNAGILGQLQSESGHFLASPYGMAFAELPPAAPDRASYDSWARSGFSVTAEDPRSTFSVDVDTGSYSLMRARLSEGRLPAPPQVRVEELVNYFDYAYPEPTGEVPISITSEVGPCPWDDAHRLVHLGLQGEHVAAADVPPRNLVFLIDVSGSMAGQLPLVVSSLAYLTEQLGARDRISIVVYAGAAGTVLPPTVGTDKARILGALDRLSAGGSTNGGEGIELAYRLAERHFVEGGINRVVVATDGDFNVGITGHDALVELIEAKRRSGVFLSVLGYGSGGYQDRTMEQLADKGNGNYAYIDGLAEARKVLVEQAGATLQTIAKDVKIQVDFDPDVVERYRLVGYTNRVLADRDFDDDTKDAGDVGAGHTVTALYEIVPRSGAAAGGSLMELKLRYKRPDHHRSQRVRVTVPDDGADLSRTSDDFRFAAAVAGFGQALQGIPVKDESGSLRGLRDLARDARGADRHCRRAELVGLIEAASALRGHPLDPARIACTPSSDSGPVVHSEPLPFDDVAEERPSIADSASPRSGDAPDEPFDWSRFIVEILYLLPPLLALPLFVMALRRPRRRRG